MAARVRFLLVDVFLLLALLSAVFALTRDSWEHMLALSVAALAVFVACKVSRTRRDRVIAVVQGLVTFIGAALGFFVALRYYPHPAIWWGISHHLTEAVRAATSNHGTLTNLDCKVHLLFMASYYEAIQGRVLRIFTMYTSFRRAALPFWLSSCTGSTTWGIRRSLFACRSQSVTTARQRSGSNRSASNEVEASRLGNCAGSRRW
jgi:hypothetical protein